MQPAHALVQNALEVLPVRAGEAGTGGAALGRDRSQATSRVGARVLGW